MYVRVIEGIQTSIIGPSIEDKVMRFADRNQHQISEPGLTSNEIYPNGISSLPFDVQPANRPLDAGDGERRWIVRPGYAIEYDFDPRAI